MSGTKIEQDSGLPFNSKGQLMLRADGVPADAYKVKGRSYTNARDMYARIAVKRSSDSSVLTDLETWMDGRVINVKTDFGAVGDDVADDTAALNAAYAAATNGAIFLPEGTYKTTSKLDWDAAVCVIGENRDGTIIKPAGNFDAIEIGSTGGGGFQVYTEFSVTRGSGTGAGMVLNEASRVSMSRLLVDGHSSHGIHLKSGNLGSYRDIQTLSNGGDGFNVEGGSGNLSASANACTFINIDTRSNTGYGFSITGDTSSNAASNWGGFIISQNNTGGGVQVDTALANSLTLYVENNTGPEVNITANSTRTHLHMLNGDMGDIVDNGTDTTITGPSISSGNLRVYGVAPPQPGSSGSGRNLSVGGGIAKTSGNGGDLLLSGGDPQGSGGPGNIRCFAKGFYLPPNDLGAGQLLAPCYAGNGAPDNTVGVNGSFYFRGDGTASANTLVYHKEGGVYVNRTELTASTTWDPGSLADGAGETKSITVTNAAPGDFVLASFSLDLQDMILTGYVQAGDTVEVRLQNETGGTIDLGSGTLRVRVIPQ